jgi:glutathione S-transferase
MVTLEKEFPEHRPMWPSASDEKLSKKVSQLLTLERRVFSQWFGWLTSSSEGPRASMHAVLNQVDEELGKGSGLFLSGDGWEGVSVVDCMFAPFLERMDASLLFYKGLSLRGGRYSNIARWFDTMEARTDTYAGIRSDYYSHVTALPPQIGNIYTTKVQTYSAVSYRPNAFLIILVPKKHNPLLPL